MLAKPFDLQQLAQGAWKRWYVSTDKEKAREHRSRALFQDSLTGLREQGEVVGQGGDEVAGAGILGGHVEVPQVALLRSVPI